MPFLTEPEPERGAVLPVMPGISRIVAANPGPMTYHGTNTYLIDTPDGMVVLDPGPEDHPEHVEAILRATGANVALILVSHTHHDHVGAVPALQEATGAPTVGFRESGDDTFSPTSSWPTATGSPACRRSTRRAMPRTISASPCPRRRHRGAVQRRSRDVVVHQRGQPAGRRHGGLFRQPATAAGPHRRCVPARPRAAVAGTARRWCARC